MPLHNFGIVTPRLYRCAQPDAAGFRDLNHFGVSMILKLNTDVDYPVDRERGEFTGGVWPRPISTFRPNAKVATDVVAQLQLATQQNVVAVHCTHGRDRTGLIIGAWRLLVDRWTLDAVNDERALYGSVSIVHLVTHEIDEVLAEIAQQTR